MSQSVFTDILNFAILLAAAKVLGEVAGRARFPSVLGEILAGLLLGPSLFNVVPNSHFLEVAAAIGILLLLFLAGLEIDLATVRRVSAGALLIALLGVVVPVVGGSATSYWLGLPTKEAVFIGSILAATSVGLSIRILVDIGQFRTKVGTSIVMAAVLDDIIGILLLSAMTTVVAVGHLPSAWSISRLIGLLVAFILCTLLIGWRFKDWLLKLIGRFRVDEALLAFCFSIAVFLALLAREANVAAIMGVFLFGIVLNPSRQGQILAERLTTVGNGLFIPIFFAHIGLTADIKLVSQAGLLTLVFVSVAIAGKVIGCALGAKPWFSLKDSLRIGVGMIPRAEVALLMASIGLKSKIISPRIFAVVVVMVFITNLLSPVVIRLAFLGRKGNGANERAEESHGVQEG